MQLLKKWFIDTSDLLKQVNVNAINFWNKLVGCKVKAYGIALKPHVKQKKRTLSIQPQRKNQLMI